MKEKGFFKKFGKFYDQHSDEIFTICLTLLLIALSILFFIQSARIDRLENKLFEIQSETEYEWLEDARAMWCDDLIQFEEETREYIDTEFYERVMADFAAENGGEQ